MTISASAFTFVLTLAMMPASSWAADLSSYRNFQFGTSLATVAKQANTNPSQARVIQRRPALIEELEWRPKPSITSSSIPEPAKEVVFSFYDGELFRIVVNYDRYETEGLTAADIIDAISVSYGTATRASALTKSPQSPYGDREDALAQWQDSQYRFELIRPSYGPSFRLTGVLKKLEAPVQAAILEAKRLDDEEAPKKEAARIAIEQEDSRAKLGKGAVSEQAELSTIRRYRTRSYEQPNGSLGRRGGSAGPV